MNSKYLPILSSLCFLSACSAFLQETESASNNTPSPSTTPSTATTSNQNDNPNPVIIDTPLITQVKSIEADKIQIEFLNEMDPSAGIATNYVVNQSLSITAATLDSTKKIATLSINTLMFPKKTKLDLINIKTLDLSKTINASVTFVPATKVAFLSSQRGTANLSTWANANGKTGIAAAHEVCKAEASMAGFEGEFYAWLSDQNTNAKTIHEGTTGGWIQPSRDNSRDVFSLGITELLRGEVLTPLSKETTGWNVAYTNTLTGDLTISGTYSNGTLISGASTCDNWTNASGNTPSGNSASSGAQWTLTNLSTLEPCSSQFRINCLQKSNAHSLILTPRSGKKVFITSVQGTGNLLSWADAAGAANGREAGDRICQKRAQASGFSNFASFKSYTSSSTQHASAKFINRQGVYVNTRGVFLGNNLDEVIQGIPGVFRNGIAFDENGAAITSGSSLIYTASTSGGQKDGESHCDNWQNGTSALTGGTGSVGRASIHWTQYRQFSCNTMARLACFED